MADAWQGRRAVITGAGSGLGKAFAQELAGRGVDLVLCDVDEERLDGVIEEVTAKGVKAERSRVDVSDAAAVHAFADATFEGGPVDLLINNAGVAVAGRAVDVPAADWAWIVGVNLLGVAHGCGAFLPRMDAQDGRAAVINMASASAFGGVPGLGAYAATKAAVLSYSETLHAELDPASVHVVCVCPGFVETRILADSRMRTPDPEATRERAVSKVFRDDRSPDMVIRAALSAVEKGRFLVPVFAEGRIGALARGLPEGLKGTLRRQMARHMLGMAEGT